MDFSKASNGEYTCSENGFKLHSSYNPSKEAERFSENIQCDFIPKYILITEPALSYCAVFLRKRFRNSILCCLRYTKEFDASNIEWNHIFYACKENGKQNINLAEEIFSFMSDEGIISTLFLSWKPSEKAFPCLYDFSWNEIKKAVLKSRSVLSTTAYFSRRWTKNALRFSIFTKNTAYLTKGSSDIVICASGPSLKSSIPFLKEYRKHFYLIAVSSALTPLLHYGIIPDLCISTDGGYWAKLHTSFSMTSGIIPLAMPGEGASFADILKKTTVIPLFYGDGCSETILRCSEYQGLQALRNGSVSGTAAQLALSLTDGDIFYCGLDLSYTKGLSHTQPNELEKNDEIYDNRLNTMETRITKTIMNNSSIEIYRSWFSSTDFSGRLFRLSADYKYSSELANIKDVNWNFFKEKTKDFSKKIKPALIRTKKKFDKKERIAFLMDLIKRNLSNPEWIKTALPAENIIFERTKETENRKKIAAKINDGMKSFYDDIIRALGENISV